MDSELNNSDPNVDSVDFTNADEFDHPDDEDEEGETITSKKVSLAGRLFTAIILLKSFAFLKASRVT